MNRITGIIAVVLAVCLAGCASEVRRQPAELMAVTPVTPMRTSDAVAIHLDSGYRRVIEARTGWVEVGSVSQGRVYRPLDTVFTVEGRHSHEAYLVVNDGRLVGFYLPVEKAFSPLKPAIRFPLEPKE